MKKKLFKRFFLSGIIGKRNLLIMKNTILLLIVFNLQVSANVLSQNTVTLDLQNATLKECIKAIEKKTDMGFLYKSKEIKDVEGINIFAKEETVQNVLETILTNTGLTYSIVNNVILIKPQPGLRTQEVKSPVQEKIKVTGNVTDKEGNPLPGVNILEKGTTNGVTTDPEGNYTIEVNSTESVLQYSFIGMATKEIKVENNASLNVVLLSTDIELNEVMIVAFGSVKKSSFTGSASEIKSEELQKKQVSTITQALAGVSSGVQVSSPSGQPGSEATIRIRGIGSANASSNPLIVVDGVPYSGSLSSVNPQDIESTTILKDASASALYGARGANGVILINTKKGKSGKSVINFEARWGVNSRAISDYEVIDNPKDYYELAWQAYKTQLYEWGITPDWTGQRPFDTDEEAMQFAITTATEDLVSQKLMYNCYDIPDGEYLVGTDGKLNSNAVLLYQDDWEDALFSNGSRNEYNLSIIGGNDKTSHYLSFGYLNDEGYLANSKYERFSSRLNLDHNVNDWLKAGANIAFTRDDRNTPVSTGQSEQNSFYWLRMAAPIYPVYLRDSNGDYVLNQNGEKQYDYGVINQRPFGGGKRYNPVAISNIDIFENLNNTFSARSYAEVSLLEGLTYTGRFSGDFIFTEETNYNHPLGSGADTQGRSEESKYNRYVYNINHLLSYKKTFSELHTINILVGYEGFKSQIKFLSASKDKFLAPDNYQLANGIILNNATSYATDYAVEGYLSRISYDYSGKYYFSGSYRRDGSSKFYKDNRWGNFWSVGASWRISEETFMQDFDWLDNLKYKISYGTQGNDAIGGDFPYDIQYTVVNNNGNIGLTQGGIKENKELKWEVSKNFNTGIEFRVFNRLNANIEYFRREVSDMIFTRPLWLSSGYSGIIENIGDMNNKGFEVELSGDIIRNEKLVWSVGLNATHYKNTITKLPDGKDEMNVSYIRKYVVGGSIYDIYVAEYAGVDENGIAQFWNYPTEDNGLTEPEKVTNPYNATRVKAGSAIPGLMGGVNTSIDYKGFDFSIYCNYQIGGEIYDNVYGTLMRGGEAGSNWHKDMLNYWTPENQSDVPRLKWEDRDAAAVNDRMVIDASYFNIQNITLGYTFSEKIASKVKVSQLRLYCVADNVWLFSKRKGLDPRQFINGVSSDTYSIIRSISLGINVKF